MNKFENSVKDKELSEDKIIERSLPPPMEIYNVPKLVPITDPGFCDHPTLSSFDQIPRQYDWIETEPKEELFTPEFIEKINRTILGFSNVKELLQNKDFLFIGTSKIDVKPEKDNQEKSYLLSVIYNYTDNITIEVYHDIDLEKIIKIEQSHYQPAPTQEEIKQAIEIAKMDNFIKDKISDDMNSGAILVGDIDKDSEYYNHRILDVRFGHIHERLPSYQALIDISTKNVIRSGSICSCNSNHNHTGSQ
jgi:hypothetical protein